MERCECNVKFAHATEKQVISINQLFKVPEHMPSALAATDQWPCR